MAEANGIDLVIFHDKSDGVVASWLQSSLDSLEELARSHHEAFLSTLRRTENVEDVAGTLEDASRNALLIPIVSQASFPVVEKVILNELSAAGKKILNYSVHWLALSGLDANLLDVLEKTRFPITFADLNEENSVKRAAQEIYNTLAAGSLQGYPGQPDTDWDLPTAIAAIFIEADVSPSPALQRLLADAAENFAERDDSSGGYLVSVSSLFHAMFRLGLDIEQADQVSWLVQKNRTPAGTGDDGMAPQELA